MSTCAVSVIMPVYNGEKFISDAIESILNQTFSNFELIIVNDGSTDNTEQVISKYLNDRRITYYKNKANLGLAHSYNRALSLSKGDYIAIMDCDDVCLPDRLKLEVDILDKYRNVYLVYSPVQFLNDKKEVFSTWGGSKGRDISRPTVFYDLYIDGNFISNPTIMLRRNHHLNNFYRMDMECCNDFEFILRIAHDYDIYEIERPLVKMRRGEGHNSISAMRQLNFLAQRQILKLIYKKYKAGEPKVTKKHYRQAMRNQLGKERQYYTIHGKAGVIKHGFLNFLQYVPGRKKNLIKSLVSINSSLKKNALINYLARI